MSKRHYVALDGLRGEVALVVAATHTTVILGHQPFRHGYLAVDFFFILSGFVISNAYEKRLHAAMTFSQFVILRAIRLYPMIVIGALAGALTAIVTTEVPITTVIAACAAAILVLPFPSHELFRAPHEQFGSMGFSLWPIDPPAWSLFWEILVNILFVTVLYKVRTKMIFIILSLSFVLMSMAAFKFNTLETGFIVENWWGGLARVIFGFTLGMILNRLNLEGRIPIFHSNIWIISLIVLTILAFPLNEFKGLYDLIAVSFLFPLIVICGLNAETKGDIWVWSGRLSYPLYLIHAPILYILKPLTENSTSAIRIIYYFSFLVIYMIVAILVTVFYDEPLRATLGKFNKSRSQSPLPDMPVNP